MTARRWHSAALLPCALLAAAGALAGEHPDGSPLPLASTRAVLQLIPSAEAAQALAQHRAGGIDPASAEEQQLLHECSNDEAQRPTRGFIWSVMSSGWRVLLQPLAASVRAELQQYATVSEASASGFYYEGGDSSSKAPLVSRVSCLRYTRLAADGEDAALDFVASVRLDATRDAIRLRPLRLYISQSGAKSANGRYAVAIAVRAQAVWRDEFAGHDEQLFELTVAREGVDLKQGSYLRYYPADPLSGTRVPIVPVSYASDRSHPYGWAQFGVRVAEVGVQPTTLKLLAELLPEPDALGQLLMSAARAGAGQP
jgi:hypothetical protein